MVLFFDVTNRLFVSTEVWAENSNFLNCKEIDIRKHLYFMRQQFYTNLALHWFIHCLENILWKCRSINRWLIKGRCKISSVNALIWRFFFEILSFPVFKKSGNGFSILFLVAILQELKSLEYYSRPNSNLVYQT